MQYIVSFGVIRIVYSHCDKKNVSKRELPILLGATAVVALFIAMFGLNSAISLNDLAVTRWEGIILVALMIAYMTYLVVTAKTSRTTGRRKR